MKKKKINNRSKNTPVAIAESDIADKPHYITLLLLWGVYLFLTFQAPNSASNQLGLSEQMIMFLRFTIVIPYLLIWLAALYAYIKTKRYALSIQPSSEAIAFDKIATGIFFLLVSLILSALINTLRSYLVNDVEMRPVLTILTNYAYVLPYLIAFIFFLQGTIELVRQQVDSKITFLNYAVFGIPLALFAYIWLEFIFSNPFRITAGGGSQFATYYLRDSLLILTIVIPSLLTWVIGLRTILKIWLYHKKVEGILYKRALSSFVYGLTSVVLGSVIIQALLSLGAQRLLDLGLVGLLEVIYLFIFIQLLGFFLVARGAKRLARIEEV